MKTKKLRISLVGRTNAGKSTLINRIVGEKISIQNKKINTTQDTIIGIRNIKESQFLFYDTPGSNFLKNLDSQSKKLKKNLWNGIDESDLILYLIDASSINTKFLFEQLEKINETKKKIIVTFNKTDLILNKKLLPIITKISNQFKVESFFTISAKKNIGIDDIETYEISLKKYTEDALNKIDGIKVVGTAKDKVGIFSFTTEKVHYYDLGLLLDAKGIALRTGHHCTQPLMDKYSLDGTARLSLAIYNSTEEVDYFVESLSNLIKR